MNSPRDLEGYPITRIKRINKILTILLIFDYI